MIESVVEQEFREVGPSADEPNDACFWNIRDQSVTNP
jgi:hypothetical protein